jgi:hypothetical protein
MCRRRRLPVWPAGCANRLCPAPGTPPGRAERIAAVWRRRWLARRIDHGPALQALGASRGWLLSALMPTWAEPAPLSASAEASRPAGQGDPAGGPYRDELDFWRRLAQAGANAIAEGLSDREFERLQLATELEELLLDWQPISPVPPDAPPDEPGGDRPCQLGCCCQLHFQSPGFVQSARASKPCAGGARSPPRSAPAGRLGR